MTAEVWSGYSAFCQSVKLYCACYVAFRFSPRGCISHRYASILYWTDTSSPTWVPNNFLQTNHSVLNDTLSVTLSP